LGLEGEEKEAMLMKLNAVHFALHEISEAERKHQCRT
jgi:hypothetical protein